MSVSYTLLTNIYTLSLYLEAIIIQCVNKMSCMCILDRRSVRGEDKEVIYVLVTGYNILCNIFPKLSILYWNKCQFLFNLWPLFLYYIVKISDVIYFCEDNIGYEK